MCKIDGWNTDKDGGQRRANINKNLGDQFSVSTFAQQSTVGKHYNEPTFSLLSWSE